MSKGAAEQRGDYFGKPLFRGRRKLFRIKVSSFPITLLIFQKIA